MCRTIHQPKSYSHIGGEYVWACDHVGFHQGVQILLPHPKINAGRLIGYYHLLLINGLWENRAAIDGFRENREVSGGMAMMERHKMLE